MTASLSAKSVTASLSAKSVTLVARGELDHDVAEGQRRRGHDRDGDPEHEAEGACGGGDFGLPFEPRGETHAGGGSMRRSRKLIQDKYWPISIV